MDRIRAVIQGRVQGVGFRNFVWWRARQLGLAGEVKNRPDGGVEVVAEGPRARLEELVGALREGPRAARVTEVTEEWTAGAPDYEGFEISG